MGTWYDSDGRSWKDIEPWRGVPEPRDPGRRLSPAGWVVPDGLLAAWDWLPPGGASPRLDLAPRWLRCWYWTPFVDRWAHAYMWRRGYYEVDPGPGGGAQDRQATRPGRPPAPTLPAEATFEA